MPKHDSEERPMKRCLITGSEGFIGSHLSDLLVDRGLDIYGMVYGDTTNIEHLKGRITFLECDLNDRERVKETVEKAKPDVVFHLAAQSFVTVSWEDPEETLRTNVFGTLNLLEAIKRANLDPIVLVVGSSAIYGPCDEKDMPLSESQELRPTSMYGVSKATEDMLGHFYWSVFGLRVIRVRPFNMTGPRKVLDACSDFARGIAEIEKGQREVIDIGNLETVRDFTDGRDAVNALWLLAQKGVPGEVYNLGSGKAHKMRDVLEKLIELSGGKIQHRVVAEKMRPSDDRIYVADISKLRALGWEPERPFEETLQDSLNYWREQLDEA